jgi:CMP-N-acetylneuraminic acid synthetase
MNILQGECWVLVPARGGSKSIPLKNIADFAGRPLIDYGVLAAQAAARISRVICSTDAPEIAARCRELGAGVHQRPPELAGDATPVMAVIAHFARDMAAKEGGVAEMIALVQPTSPFLLPEHLDGAIAALVADADAGSAQTVIECPHNHHAFNQRGLADGYVDFVFAAERQAAYNKQTKPKHYLFGNIVVLRTQRALEQNAVFARPSRAVEIPEIFGFDADGPDDFRLGALMLAGGMITLPHLGPPGAGQK